jgi:hypothetical protein
MGNAKNNASLSCAVDTAFARFADDFAGKFDGDVLFLDSDFTEDSDGCEYQVWCDLIKVYVNFPTMQKYIKPSMYAEVIYNNLAWAAGYLND